MDKPRRVRMTWYKDPMTDRRIYEVYDLPTGRRVHRSRSWQAAQRARTKLRVAYARLDAYNLLVAGAK